MPPPRIHRHRYHGVPAPNARLLARIYEVLPLLCPSCGGEMRIVSFLTEPVPDYEFDQSVPEEFEG